MILIYNLGTKLLYYISKWTLLYAQIVLKKSVIELLLKNYLCSLVLRLTTKRFQRVINEKYMFTQSSSIHSLENVVNITMICSFSMQQLVYYARNTFNLGADRWLNVRKDYSISLAYINERMEKAVSLVKGLVSMSYKGLNYIIWMNLSLRWKEFCCKNFRFSAKVFGSNSSVFICCAGFMSYF